MLPYWTAGAGRKNVPEVGPCRKAWGRGFPGFFGGPWALGSLARRILLCGSAPCARYPFAPLFDFIVPAEAGGAFQQPKAGHPVAIVFDCCDTANGPLTQRAFRRPAGRRVTFLLLAQKKSNPKKMAFRAKARSSTWDRSVGRLRQALVRSLLPQTKPLHRNAPIRRGLKAISLDCEESHRCRAFSLSPPGRGLG
jgi:hypothetical protein